MEGRVLKRRTTLGRKRLAALLACSLVAIIVPLSATAEYGIPAGSGATITAGQPLLVRVAPGWDAEVSYEIADGSYVTVWGGEQAAPDGSLWYPIDGGFVPAEGVTSAAAVDGGLALYQEAATDTWVDPNTAQGWIDSTTGQWVDPAATQGWVDPTTGEWIDPNAPQQGWVDPTTGEWVDPNAVVEPAATGEGWIDPATGEWVEPGKAAEWIDPNASADEWVDPNASGEGWIDPNTGEWVEPAAKTDDWIVEGSVAVDAPVTEEWVEPAPMEIAAGGGPDAWGEPIGTAYIAGTNGDGATCRAAPERGTEKLAVLGEGAAVEVRGEAIGEWQPVNCAGVGGYVNTSLIAWEPSASVAEMEQRRRDRDRDKNGNAGNAGNDGSESAGSQQIVDFAMQFEGYPYVYAGEGPYAFDCSGFTKFVIQNTLGMDITHDMFAQYDMGQQVGRNELQPGDLVFFANTFRPGMSHNGIYIGNGQMIHAENESTGVKISDINSDYYSSRWFGAVRFG
jgi:hypothetical protein